MVCGLIVDSNRTILFGRWSHRLTTLIHFMTLRVRPRVTRHPSRASQSPHAPYQSGSSGRWRENSHGPIFLRCVRPGQTARRFMDGSGCCGVSSQNVCSSGVTVTPMRVWSGLPASIHQW